MRNSELRIGDVYVRTSDGPIESWPFITESSAKVIQQCDKFIVSYVPRGRDRRCSAITDTGKKFCIKRMDEIKKCFKFHHHSEEFENFFISGADEIDDAKEENSHKISVLMRDYKWNKDTQRWEPR